MRASIRHTSMIYAPLVIATLSALVASAPSSNARPVGPAKMNGNPGKNAGLRRRCGGFGGCGFGDCGFGGCGEFGGCGFGNCGGFGGYGGSGCGGYGPTIIDNTCCFNEECFHDACFDCNTEAAAFCDNQAFNEVDSNCCSDFTQNTFIC